jgi:capsular polysaccharide export protein
MATGFLKKLGEALAARGHAVRRITFNAGDLLFWPRGEGAHFRGGVHDFPRFLAPRLDDWAVSDIVLFGDCRPLHQAAIEMAKARNIVVHVIEEGYLRPNWVTVEPFGVNGHSGLPRDSEHYLREAKALPVWTGGAPVGGSFRRRAIEDVAYNVAAVLGRPLYMGYRTHRPWHPFLEYAGWLKQLALKLPAERSAQRALTRLAGSGKPYYLHPLQLDCDSQIRHHSGFGRIKPALEHVIASFSRAAPRDAVLVVKEHPLDNGLKSWRRLCHRIAVEHGVDHRLVYVRGGDLNVLLTGSSGVVVVNSTVGFLALSCGVPVIALGEAIYDLDGMTFQGGLDDFWENGAPADPTLFDAFRRVVAARTQVNGGFFSEKALALAVEGAVERLEGEAAPVRRARAPRVRESTAVGG